MQRHQVLRQLFINLNIGRVNCAAVKRFPLGVIGGITTVDGIKVVEPEVIGVDEIQRVGIFFAPIFHHGCRI